MMDGLALPLDEALKLEAEALEIVLRLRID